MPYACAALCERHKRCIRDRSYTVEPINTGIYADNIYAGENITAYIEGGQVYQSGNVYEEDNSEFKRIGNSVGIVDLSLGNTFSVGIDANDNLWRWGKRCV